MATYKGYKSGIMYVSEAVYGTPVAVSTALQGKVTSFVSNWNNNFFREQGLGEGRNQTYTGFGPFDCGGTIEWSVSRFDFLTHLIGAQSGAGTGASPYSLTEGDNIGFIGNDIKSFTMQCFSDDSSDSIDTYSGCLLNSVTLTAAEGDMLRASAEWVAQSVATNTAGVTYTADTSLPWSFQQGTLKYGATPTAVAKVTNFTLTIANNLLIYRALGSRLIQQPETGLRKYDFTITLKMTDAVLTTLLQDVLGQASSPHLGVSAAAPTASNEVTLLFAGPTNTNAWVQLDEAYLDSVSRTVDLGGGIVEGTFTGHAWKGLSNVPIKWQISA